MRVIITGCAGFIGFSLARKLLNKKIEVIGIDNLNSYYSRKLKFRRLKILNEYKNFNFYKKDCSNNNFLSFLKKDRISYIFHFAAEVGVRNSYSKPEF